MANAQANTPSVYAPQLFLFGVAALVITCAVLLTSSIVESDSGLSMIVRSIGIGLAVWAMIRPKSGLYILTFEAFSLDLIKKYAVYYGVADTTTIVNVLIVGMLAVSGTILGTLVQGAIFRRFKITRLHWSILGAVAVLALSYVLATHEQFGLVKAAENSFNTSVYIALAIPISIFLAERDQLDQLLTAQFWLAVVWAVWGIKQYYTGFTSVEWFYAETGLSQVASNFMLNFPDPRPFGFGSGAPNYGVVGPYFSYGLWQLCHRRDKKLLFGLGTAILFWGVVASMQRTTLVLPFVAIPLYFLFKTKVRTIYAYVAGTCVFLAGVWYSEDLMVRLNDISAAIGLQGRWSQNVLVVGTFSDRLQGWIELKNPKIYSLFGTHDWVYTHDLFSKIILAYGVVGLLSVLSVAGAGAWYIHRSVLRIADEDDRRFATYLLALLMLSVAVAFGEGDNFSSTPTNLQLWSFLGVIISIVVHSRKVVAPVAPQVRRQPETLFQLQRQSVSA